jgi:hypothetical protein
VAEPSPAKASSYLDQLIRESERDLPITLPPATILIEAVKDLQSTIDGLEARIFALENP